MKITLKELPNKVKEVTFEFELKEVKQEYDHCLVHFKDAVNIKGFRKGKAPTHLVKEKIDKNKLDQEVLQHLFPTVVEKAIKEYKIIPIMQPKLKLDYLSEEKGCKGIITFVERPEVTLAKYKDIAKVALKEIQKKEEKDKSEKKSEIVTAKNINEAKQKAKEAVKERSEKIDNAKQEMPLEQKILVQIYNQMVDKSKIELADVMKQEEANRLMGQFMTQLSRLGIQLEDYLKQTGIKIEKIREDYATQAERSLKLEFILSEISTKEGLKIDEKEIQAVIDNTPDEKQKELLSTPEQKYYIESTLLKNKVARMLIEIAQKAEK